MPIAMQNRDFAQPGLEIEVKLWDLTSKGNIAGNILSKFSVVVGLQVEIVIFHNT
jgi:hypothetical protein